MPLPMRHAALVAGIALLLAGAPVSAAPSTISPADWRVHPDGQYTNVPAASHKFEFQDSITPKPVSGGSYRFGVRMPRVNANQPPGGRPARLGVYVLFTAIEADQMTVTFWVAMGTRPADPPGFVIQYVH